MGGAVGTADSAGGARRALARLHPEATGRGAERQSLQNTADELENFHVDGYQLVGVRHAQDRLSERDWVRLHGFVFLQLRKASSTRMHYVRLDWGWYGLMMQGPVPGEEHLYEYAGGSRLRRTLRALVGIAAAMIWLPIALSTGGLVPKQPVVAWWLATVSWLLLLPLVLADMRHQWQVQGAGQESYQLVLQPGSALLRLSAYLRCLADEGQEYSVQAFNCSHFAAAIVEVLREGPETPAEPADSGPVSSGGSSERHNRKAPPQPLLVTMRPFVAAFVASSPVALYGLWYMGARCDLFSPCMPARYRWWQIGAPLLGLLFGRRLCLSVACLIATVGCGLHCAMLMDPAFFKTKGMPSMASLEFLAAELVSFGVLATLAPALLYISEAALTKHRGKWLCMFQFWLMFGHTINFIMHKLSQGGENGDNVSSMGYWFHLGVATLSMTFLIWLVPPNARGPGTFRMCKPAVAPVVSPRQPRHLPLVAPEEGEDGRCCKGCSAVCRVLMIMGLQLLQPLATYAAFPYIKLTSPAAYISVPVTMFAVPLAICLLLIDSRFGGRRVLLLASCILVGLGSILNDDDARGDLTQCAAALLAWGPVLWVYTAEAFTRDERRWAIPLLILTWHGVQFISHDNFAKWQVAALNDLNSSKTALGVIFILLFVRETRCWPTEEMPALFSFKDRLPLPALDAAIPRSASCISSNKSLAISSGQNSPLSGSRRGTKALLSDAV